MKMEFIVVGRLNTSSKVELQGIKGDVKIGIRGKLFYLLMDEKSVLLSHGEIKDIAVIQDGKRKNLKVDEFLASYKNIL